MGISKTTLSSKIETELQTIFGSPADSIQLKKFCDAIAKAVVDEIQSNAVVNTTVTGTVTSGVGTGGVVLGSGVGTVS